MQVVAKSVVNVTRWDDSAEKVLDESARAAVKNTEMCITPPQKPNVELTGGALAPESSPA